MKQRCLNPVNPRYAEWGGRGIVICERWRTSFDNFFADMGLCPPGQSIERIDNDGNYEPGNCKWASGSEQQRNKKNNHYAEAFGRTLILADWAREIGVHQSTIVRALQRGDSVENVARRAGYRCA